jgi:hypothetical protein
MVAAFEEAKRFEGEFLLRDVRDALVELTGGTSAADEWKVVHRVA